MLAESEPEVVLGGDVPIQSQIQQQIRDLIAMGKLHPGEELPTVRAMAVGLAVSPSLVRKAYEDLEHAGYVTTADGSGTFVTPRKPLPVSPERSDEFISLCQSFLENAARFGVSRAELLVTLEMLLEGRE